MCCWRAAQESRNSDNDENRTWQQRHFTKVDGRTCLGSEWHHRPHLQVQNHFGVKTILIFENNLKYLADEYVQLWLSCVYRDSHCNIHRVSTKWWHFYISNNSIKSDDYKFVRHTWKMSLHYLVKCRCLSSGFCVPKIIIVIVKML